MINKVDYWLDLCDDDLQAARDMLKSNNFLWMGFICHLIVEKALKAAFRMLLMKFRPKRMIYLSWLLKLIFATNYLKIIKAY